MISVRFALCRNIFEKWWLQSISIFEKYYYAKLSLNWNWAYVFGLKYHIAKVLSISVENLIYLSHLLRSYISFLIYLFVILVLKITRCSITFCYLLYKNIQYLLSTFNGSKSSLFLQKHAEFLESWKLFSFILVLKNIFKMKMKNKQNYNKRVWLGFICMFVASKSHITIKYWI